MNRRNAALMLGLTALILTLVAGYAAAQQRLNADGGKQSEPGAPAAELAKPAAPAVGAPAGALAPSARSAAPAVANAPQQTAQQPPIDISQRLIVRNASLSLLVNDVTEAAIKARNLAESLQGFVVNSVQREENGKPAATITIRVPAAKFDQAMDGLKGLAVRVSNEQASSKDVTEEFVDTEARLRNLKATEERYLALLQQARTVEDILKVEQQLSNIRGQIEQLQGRLQFLQRSAETSLITVEVRPYAAAQPLSPDWSLVPVFDRAWAALRSTFQLLVSGLIWVVVFTPIWLPVGFLIWRQRRRRSTPSAAPARPASPAATT